MLVRILIIFIVAFKTSKIEQVQSEAISLIRSYQENQSEHSIFKLLNFYFLYENDQEFFIKDYLFLFLLKHCKYFTVIFEISYAINNNSQDFSIDNYLLITTNQEIQNLKLLQQHFPFLYKLINKFHWQNQVKQGNRNKHITNIFLSQERKNIFPFDYFNQLSDSLSAIIFDKLNFEQKEYNTLRSINIIEKVVFMELAVLPKYLQDKKRVFLIGAEYSREKKDIFYFFALIFHSYYDIQNFFNFDDKSYQSLQDYYLNHENYLSLSQGVKRQDQTIEQVQKIIDVLSEKAPIINSKMNHWIFLQYFLKKIDLNEGFGLESFFTCFKTLYNRYSKDKSIQEHLLCMIAYNNKTQYDYANDIIDLEEKIYLSLNSNYMIDYLDFFVDFEQELKMQNSLNYIVFRAMHGSLFYLEKLLKHEKVKTNSKVRELILYKKIINLGLNNIDEVLKQNWQEVQLQDYFYILERFLCFECIQRIFELEKNKDNLNKLYQIIKKQNMFDFLSIQQQIQIGIEHFKKRARNLVHDLLSLFQLSKKDS